MTAPSGRRFRFSLITLLVAVNVAGVLVWANVRGRADARYVNSFQQSERFHGWPMVIYAKPVMILPFRIGGRSSWPSAFYWDGLLNNIVVGISFIGLSSFLTEFLVRKLRKAKRHDG